MEELEQARAVAPKSRWTAIQMIDLSSVIAHRTAVEAREGAVVRACLVPRQPVVMTSDSSEATPEPWRGQFPPRNKICVSRVDDPPPRQVG